MPKSESSSGKIQLRRDAGAPDGGLVELSPRLEPTAVELDAGRISANEKVAASSADTLRESIEQVNVGTGPLEVWAYGTTRHMCNIQYKEGSRWGLQMEGVAQSKGGWISVCRVVPGSPVDCAGVCVGDIVISIDGAPPLSLDGASQTFISAAEQGLPIQLEIERRTSAADSVSESKCKLPKPKIDPIEPEAGSKSQVDVTNHIVSQHSIDVDTTLRESSLHARTGESGIGTVVRSLGRGNVVVTAVGAYDSSDDGEGEEFC